MNKNLKKIIAREGLIFLTIFLIGLVIAWWGTNYIRPSRYFGGLEGHWVLGSEGKFIMIFGCPFYLLIRFIIWAIKTLRENNP